MGTWETREATFEKVEEIDAALRFRSLARRNKLIGLWAAEKLGIRGDAAIITPTGWSTPKSARTTTKRSPPGSAMNSPPSTPRSPPTASAAASMR